MDVSAIFDLEEAGVDPLALQVLMQLHRGFGQCYLVLLAMHDECGGPVRPLLHMDSWANT